MPDKKEFVAVDYALHVWLDLPKDREVRWNVVMCLSAWCILTDCANNDGKLCKHDAIIQFMWALYNAPDELPPGIE